MLQTWLKYPPLLGRMWSPRWYFEEREY